MLRSPRPPKRSFRRYRCIDAPASTDGSLRCINLTHILDRGFPAQNHRPKLVGANGMERDDTLILTQTNHFDSDGNSIANMDGGEKPQRLAQINGTRPRKIIAQDRRDQ